MTYQGRALYNLLQMNFKQNLKLEAEPWQVEDYRSLKQEELFRRLEGLEIFLDEENFLLYVQECDSPEDLADCLYLEEYYEKHEQVYLCVFELWRRLAPHKQSLSIFVDALDHMIEEYEEGNMESEEELQAALSSFLMILDDNVDEGGDPREGYHFFSAFSCHDLEVFLYEYTAHQIDVENQTYASELLEGFFPYVDNERWFELLRARLVLETTPEEGRVMIERLLSSLKEETELFLLFEVLHFLIHVEEAALFKEAFHEALKQLETQEDLKELLIISAEYCNAIEKEEEESLINTLLEKQKDKDLSDSLEKEEEAIEILRQIVIHEPEEVRSLDNLPQ